MSKILVVDDDHGNAEVIQLVLENEGFEVESLTKSDQIQASILRFCPDLILLDILLGSDDGRCLCNIIKADSITRHIPVVLITAMLESQVDAVSCQPDGLMFKPFDYEFLTDKIKAIIAQYRSVKPIRNYGSKKINSWNPTGNLHH